MNLDEEIAALERLLGRRRVPHNVRLLREVHERLKLFRNVIGYMERLVCPRCGALLYQHPQHDLDAVQAEPEVTP